MIAIDGPSYWASSPERLGQTAGVLIEAIKETWSLITWFIYAIYLHSRFVRGWKGTQMAVISAVGFLAVIFTYLGVNLVLSGLHSYGGMN
jgi:hypothetical protein